MDHIDQNAQPNKQESQPISYSTILAACVYRTDGKCKAMLTPVRLQILHQKYNKAKSTGLHHNVSPPLQSFASELVGLIVRKARAAKQFDSEKIKDSFYCYPPSPYHSSLQTLRSCDPRENGLATGLQSRPPTLLEQPPT